MVSIIFKEIVSRRMDIEIKLLSLLFSCWSILHDIIHRNILFYLFDIAVHSNLHQNGKLKKKCLNPQSFTIWQL